MNGLNANNLIVTRLEGIKSKLGNNRYGMLFMDDNDMDFLLDVVIELVKDKVEENK